MYVGQEGHYTLHYTLTQQGTATSNINTTESQGWGWGCYHGLILCCINNAEGPDPNPGLSKVNCLRRCVLPSYRNKPQWRYPRCLDVSAQISYTMAADRCLPLTT